MKNVILIVFLLGFMPACKQAPKKLVADVPTDTGKLQDDPDLIAVTDVIHNFYKWYNAFQKNDQTRGNFVNFKLNTRRNPGT